MSASGTNANDQPLVCTPATKSWMREQPLERKQDLREQKQRLLDKSAECGEMMHNFVEQAREMLESSPKNKDMRDFIQRWADDFGQTLGDGDRAVS